MIYLQLFLSYLKIGFFGFGGGYIMLSLIQHEMVVKHQWLTAAQLADIIAVSQMTPGPIAINCATYVGYTVTGNIIGSALATLSVCLPPLSIMLLLTRWYQRVRTSPYTRSILDSLHIVMAAMIGAAMLMFLNRDTFTDWKSFVLFAAALAALHKRDSPITLIVLAAVAGLLLY